MKAPYAAYKTSGFEEWLAISLKSDRGSGEPIGSNARTALMLDTRS